MVSRWIGESINGLLPVAQVGGYEDITGLPWIEIDYPDDVARAVDVVLPRLARLA